MSGIAGWAFLNRTRERQEETFNASPRIASDTQYFREKIGKITSAEDLVKDRRLLRVALGAFGLQDEIDKRAFIRQIIEGGTEDDRSLANRLADKRFGAFAKAFGHLAKDAPTAIAPDLINTVVSQYRGIQFEVAVGEQDETMRLAMTLERELPKLQDDYSSERARWFAILGNPPLRKVFETALGLPKEFGGIDVNQQFTRLQDAVNRRFGTRDLAELSEPGKIEEITRRFLVMAQIRETQASISSGSIALTLLRGGIN